MNRNVGGGDWVTRIIACAVLVVLSVISLPQVPIAFSLLKVALLTGVELGVLCLMLGMFLRARTYFAGLQLLVIPFVMLGLVSGQYNYAAALVGIGAVVIGAREVVTRHSALNTLLRFSSNREPKALSQVHTMTPGDA